MKYRIFYIGWWGIIAALSIYNGYPLTSFVSGIYLHMNIRNLMVDKYLDSMEEEL